MSKHDRQGNDSVNGAGDSVIGWSEGIDRQANCVVVILSNTWVTWRGYRHNRSYFRKVGG